MSKQKEQLFFPMFKGQPSTNTNQGGLASNPFAGFATVNSGSAAVTVSTNLVTSGSLVFIGTQVLGAAPAHVVSGSNLVVTSIVDGTSFNIARAGATAHAYDETVGFMIWATKDR